MGFIDKYDINVKKRRKPVNKKLREAIRALQQYKCAKSGESLKRGGQLHHKNGNKSDNRITNLEYWCTKCHRKKTAKQVGEIAKVKRKANQFPY